MAKGRDPRAIKFGAHVARLRDQAGISQSELGALISHSQAWVSDAERGESRVKRDMAAAIDQALNSKGTLVAAWDVAFSTYEPPEWYRRLPEAERRAVEIQEFQPLMVPGLLQTESYARAAIATADRSMTTQQIDDKVSERLRRQEVITSEDPPRLHFVMDERILSTRFRDPGIMKEQLEHLVAMAQLPRVEMLVIPSGTRDHPGLEGGFKLLRLPEPDGEVLLYAEAPEIGGLVPDEKAVQSHIWKMASLRGVALPPDQSLAVIEQSGEGETRGD